MCDEFDAVTTSRRFYTAFSGIRQRMGSESPCPWVEVCKPMA